MQWSCENAQKSCAIHCGCAQCTTLRASYMQWVKKCATGELYIAGIVTQRELEVRGQDSTDDLRPYMTEEQYARYQRDMNAALMLGHTVQ